MSKSKSGRNHCHHTDDCKILCIYFGKIKKLVYDLVDEQIEMQNYAEFNQNRIEYESKMTQQIDMMAGVGINVVLCSNEIDNFFQNAFESAGIVAIPRLRHG